MQMFLVDFQMSLNDLKNNDIGLTESEQYNYDFVTEGVECEEVLGRVLSEFDAVHEVDDSILKVDDTVYAKIKQKGTGVTGVIKIYPTDYHEDEEHDNMSFSDHVFEIEDRLS